MFFVAVFSSKRERRSFNINKNLSQENAIFPSKITANTNGFLTESRVGRTKKTFFFFI